MTRACINCTTSRVVESGARVGALWCFVKRCGVNPDTACPSFTAIEKQGKTKGTETGPQHVLVKSAAESHFETNSPEKDQPQKPAFDLAVSMYPEAA